MRKGTGRRADALKEIIAGVREGELRALRRRRLQFLQQLGGVMPPHACRVLDVGCGSDPVVPDLLPAGSVYVGVDISLADMSLGRSSTTRRQFVIGDARGLDALFRPGSFDLVLALDVIEHLPKERGEAFLRALETLATRRVVVFTPNGFLEQGPLDGNPYQRHLSGWTPGEMAGHGYRVVGINGWRPLRGERAAIRWRPVGFWSRVSLYTQRWFVAHPHHAFQLLCTKDVGPGRTDVIP